MFGYLDESGAPGKAINKNDYLLLSLVIFDSYESVCNAEQQVFALRDRMTLPIDYEFHCSRNSINVQKNFVKLLSRIDFSFITIALKKDDRIKTASFNKLAKLMIKEICTRFEILKIEMDSNPTLYHCLRKVVREQNLKGIKLRQNKSRSSVHIQIADYVANISSRKIKGSDSSNKWFDSISGKTIAFVVIDNKK